MNTLEIKTKEQLKLEREIAIKKHMEFLKTPKEMAKLARHLKKLGLM